MRTRKTNRVRTRRHLALALAAVLALVLAACGDGADDVGDAPEETVEPDDPDEPADADDEADESPEEEEADEDAPSEGASAAELLPEGPFTFLVPVSAGGGTDRNARELAAFVQERIDRDIQVINLPGANGAIGQNVFLRDHADCSGVLFRPVPHLSFSWLTQDVGFTWDDFTGVAGINIEPGVIRVPNDSPYETLEDLLDDARDRPGEVSASVSVFASSNYIGLLQLQDIAGVEFNIIPYDGGGPARTAVVSGETDFTHAGVFNSLPIQDDTRALGVQQQTNNWPDLTDDAPTFSEVVGEDVPNNSSLQTIFAAAECRDNHPEAYQAIADVFHEVLTSDEYYDFLEERGEEAGLIDMNAEQLNEHVENEIEVLRQTIAERPEITEEQ